MSIVVLTALFLAACARDDSASVPLEVLVGQLEEQVAAAPTSAENARDRARVLWRWANALAVDGVVLPLELPRDTAEIIAGDEADVPTYRLRALDDHVRELRLKIDQPDALGRLELLTATPLPAGQYGSIKLRWTVGSRPMSEGGSLLLVDYPLVDGGHAQHRDPMAADFVTVTTSNPDLSFEPVIRPVRSAFGSDTRALPGTAFKLTGGTLSRGDEVVLTFGDRAQGSPGFLVPSQAGDHWSLPMVIDLSGGQHFLTPRWPPVAIIGGEGERLDAIVPSVVAPGEEFELTVRTEDLFGNRASGPLPGYRVYLNDEPYAELPASGGSLRTLPQLRFEDEGVYRFEVRSPLGKLSGSSNPVLVTSELRHHIYWGDLMAMSALSGGIGSLDSMFEFALEEARLDFVGLSDTDTQLDDAEWADAVAGAGRARTDGRFVAFVGYEWSAPRDRGGNQTVLLRRDGMERISNHEAAEVEAFDREAARRYQPSDYLVVAQGHQVSQWIGRPPWVPRLAAIYSMHGSFEWLGNLYLRHGHEVGFVAGSHDPRARAGLAAAQPISPRLQPGGLTAVLATSRTHGALWASMANLATYATSGERIILDVSLNGSPMGSRQQQVDERELECRVYGTSPIDRINVMKNGEPIFSRSFMNRSIAPETTLQIGFESSSQVFDAKPDNPRPYRVWRGRVEVEGAILVSVDPLGFDNPLLEGAQLESPSAASFHTETRGRRDLMQIGLEGASADTVIRIHLDPATEYGFSPRLERPPASIGGAIIELTLDQLEDGTFDHLLLVDDHRDRITVQSVDPDAALDQSLYFNDFDDSRPGDFYYVRVDQADGGRAWSSPIWVGRRSEADL